jgi:type II secretion system protein G
MKKDQKGFTLIELLVVIAIIGILSTLAVISLNNARQKAKDAKTVSDIKSIQTALELYYNDFNSYPFAAGTGVLPTSIASGTQVYMQQVPLSESGAAYAVHATGTPATTYDIPFTLYGQSGNLTSGGHFASPGAVN